MNSVIGDKLSALIPSIGGNDNRGKKSNLDKVENMGLCCSIIVAAIYTGFRVTRALVRAWKDAQDQSQGGDQRGPRRDYNRPFNNNRKGY